MRRSDFYLDKVVKYLAETSSKANGKTIKEISLAVEVSEQTLYRLMRGNRAQTLGIGLASFPAWPASYYVSPEVALLATTYKGYKPDNKTAAQAVEIVLYLLERTTKENLNKLQEAFNSTEISQDELLTAMQNTESPGALALQALVLLKHCKTKVASL